MNERVPTFLAGASGLLAGELLRFLHGHPALELRSALSREEGRALREIHPHLATPIATTSMEEGARDLGRAAASAPVCALFLALPHGESAAAWRRLAAELGSRADRVRVVDLSADYRLRDRALFETTYGGPHPDPEGAEAFVYGLPELWRSRVREAQRVAAPGCFATALQLAAVPAAEAGILDPRAAWVFHGVTGSSGSGAAPKRSTHHPFRHGNLFAYSLDGHRHEAELRQALAELRVAPRIHFVPHSGPFARGIHLSAALPLARSLESREAREIYARRFAGEEFVEVLEESVPELRSVCGSNRASLAVRAREGTLTVLIALDNMSKGGAGQALQCMNLMLGLPEGSGLPTVGTGVC